MCRQTPNGKWKKDKKIIFCQNMQTLERGSNPVWSCHFKSLMQKFWGKLFYVTNDLHHSCKSLTFSHKTIFIQTICLQHQTNFNNILESDAHMQLTNQTPILSSNMIKPCHSTASPLLDFKSTWVHYFKSEADMTEKNKCTSGNYH